MNCTVTPAAVFTTAPTIVSMLAPTAVPTTTPIITFYPNTAQCSCSNTSFFELLFSTFLGFLSALLVEAVWHYTREKLAQKELLRGLLDELCRIKDENAKLDNNQVYIKPYSISIWSGAQSSGLIDFLYRKKSYLPIVEAFSYIEEVNMNELECYRSINNGRITIEDERVKAALKSREIVISKVERAIQIIREE